MANPTDNVSDGQPPQPSNPTAPEEKRKLKASALEAKNTILQESFKADPKQFILDELMSSLQAVKEGIRLATKYAEECDFAADQLRHLTMLAKFQKQHAETLSRLTKFEEQIFRNEKNKKKNKSAAPGQKVGISNGTPEAHLCSNQTTNGRF